MTQWSPDTCECVIEYDDNIQVIAVYNKCSKHALTPDDATHLATVLAHNRKKNFVLNAVLSRLKANNSPLGPESVAAVYDANDNINIIGSNFTAADQVAIQLQVNNVLGKSTLHWT